MANIRISDLTDLTTPSGASVFPISHQGSTRKITVDNLSNYIQSSLNTSNTTYATTGQLNNSGIRLTNLINSLSGSLNSSGSNLRDNIASLSGLFTGYTGSVDSIFATEIHLTSTGSGLLTTINSLSGSLNLSGIRLTNTINSLSGASVLLYGDQSNIFGIKKFVNNIGIGIGAHTSVGKLHVSGGDMLLANSNYLQFCQNTNANGGAAFLRAATDDSFTIHTSSYSTPIKIDGSTVLLNTLSNGNVGIGTASPGSTLHVNGSQSAIRLTDTNGTPNTFRILAKDGTTNAFRIYDDTLSAERFRINSAGNVGIGVTSLSEKLEVAGNILANNLVYNTGDQNISGVKAFASRPTVNGTGVLLSGEAGQISSAIVQTTGTQNISGLKTFTDTGVFNNIQINNKLLTSYNYLTGGIFNFGNFYTTIVNSSLSTTGVLPSGITSGINYYVKNLNTGILTITGSGQRTIDGFTNINLYQNDSVNLLGMNNIGYTGWISTLANGGVS